MMRHRSLAVLGSLLGILTSGTAMAQVDLSGFWALQNSQDFINNVPGPFPVSFMGMPLSKDGRAAALAFSNESLSELQRQCEPYEIQYIVEGPWSLNIVPVTEDTLKGTIAAWHISGSVFDWLPTTIWMDGRKPPPQQALHTWNGFTVGEWHGQTLMTTTTHIKDGLLVRGGVPNSNQEMFRMFMSRHEDTLTVTALFHDPVYLTETYPLAQIFRRSAAAPPPSPAMHCNPASEDQNLATGYRSSSYLPWSNPDLKYMTDHYGIPVKAALGGADTMYPEYRQALRGHYKRPTGYCTQYCCGTISGGQGPQSFDARVLKCRM